TAPPPTRTSTLSLHDALPICVRPRQELLAERERIRGEGAHDLAVGTRSRDRVVDHGDDAAPALPGALGHELLDPIGESRHGGGRDRKSTRLNSSHVSISYAVF